MFVHKVFLPRRTVLKGLGAALSLPFLDAMVPALTAQARTAAVAKKRLACVYVPHGVILDQWTPAAAGSDFELKPIMKPLEPYRQSMVVVTNLLRPERGFDTNHAGAPSSFLTGVPPKRTAGPDFALGATLDQVVAKEIGQETTLPSLELATEDFTGLIGDCSPGYSCAYMNTLSWQNDTTPLPMEINPRLVFERLFGGGSNKEARLARLRTDKSLLDFVSNDLKTLEGSLGSKDRARLDEYLEHVREIERRMQLAESRTDSLIDVPEQPVGVPEAFEDHAKLMFDLLAIAFEADLTRVSAFMLTRELSQRTYPNIGVTEPHHTISHHGNKPPQIEAHAKVNVYHATLLAGFVQRLASTKDGDGSLLDHSLIYYGSGMGNGNVHAADHLPTLLVGGAAGTVKGNRHIVAPELTPNGNLLVSVAEKFGVKMDSFGSSTGRIAL
ncbi:MAG TPA: DUF1552 domain-containing protein [Vicinamibacterales bacterium]|nr:DUF1552 domain-containing protein [Vicinamibacterales bacterium]